MTWLRCSKKGQAVRQFWPQIYSLVSCARMPESNQGCSTFRREISYGQQTHCLPIRPLFVYFVSPQPRRFHDSKKSVMEIKPTACRSDHGLYTLLVPNLLLRGHTSNIMYLVVSSRSFAYPLDNILEQMLFLSFKEFSTSWQKSSCENIRWRPTSNFTMPGG
jgi:hypothetical protein